ncbi:unnamed protein product [Lampetra planeri]
MIAVEGDDDNGEGGDDDDDDDILYGDGALTVAVINYPGSREALLDKADDWLTPPCRVDAGTLTLTAPGLENLRQAGCQPAASHGAGFSTARDHRWLPRLYTAILPRILRWRSREFIARHLPETISWMRNRDLDLSSSLYKCLHTQGGAIGSATARAAAHAVSLVSAWTAGVLRAGLPDS